MTAMRIDGLSAGGLYGPNAKAVSMGDFLLLMEGEHVTLPDGRVVGPEDGPFYVGVAEKAAGLAVSRGLRRVRFPQGGLTLSGLLDRMRMRHHGPGAHSGRGKENPES